MLFYLKESQSEYSRIEASLGDRIQNRPAVNKCVKRTKYEVKKKFYENKLNEITFVKIFCLKQSTHILKLIKYKIYTNGIIKICTNIYNSIISRYVSLTHIYLSKIAKKLNFLSVNVQIKAFKLL